MQLNTSCKKKDADLTYILICDSSCSSNKVFLLQEVPTRKQSQGIPTNHDANIYTNMNPNYQHNLYKTDNLK